MPFPASELARQRFSEITLIDQGGTGAVYRAFDQRLRRPVAVKEISALLAPAEREHARWRFDREAQLAARLNHPAVVTVYGFEEDPRQGEAYLYLEYCVAGTLADVLAREHRLPETVALVIARDLAQAAASHWRHGIIHRDIKPANVLLVRDEREQVMGAKLTDYGIAQDLTASQRTQLTPGQGHPGTPGYLAPEQATSAQPLTAAADLYNVGLVLWEMLAGVPRRASCCAGMCCGTRYCPSSQSRRCRFRALSTARCWSRPSLAGAASALASRKRSASATSR